MRTESTKAWTIKICDAIITQENVHYLAHLINKFLSSAQIYYFIREKWRNEEDILPPVYILFEVARRCKIALHQMANLAVEKIRSPAQSIKVKCVTSE